MKQIKVSFLFILICSILAYGRHLSKHCTNQGEVRSSQNSPNYIQMCERNNVSGILEWMYVCYDSNSSPQWGYQNVFALCKLLGFEAAIDQVIPLATVVDENRDNIHNLNCGSATSRQLSGCSYAINSNRCQAIHGGNCAQLTIRSKRSDNFNNTSLTHFFNNFQNIKLFHIVLLLFVLILGCMAGCCIVSCCAILLMAVCYGWRRIKFRNKHQEYPLKGSNATPSTNDIEADVSVIRNMSSEDIAESPYSNEVEYAEIPPTLNMLLQSNVENRYVRQHHKDTELCDIFLGGENQEEIIFEEYRFDEEVVRQQGTIRVVLSQQERDSKYQSSTETSEDMYGTCYATLETVQIGTTVYYFKDTGIYQAPPETLSTLFDAMSDLKFREVNPANVQLGENVGEGQFGTVFKATWFSSYGEVPVAVKKMKHTEGDEQKVDFMREAMIMGQFHHPNVLKMIGVVSLVEPYMLLTELMKVELLGLLKRFKEKLIDRSRLPDVAIQFSKEVAEGMQYLARKNFIHRDLAARNVLVSKDMTCKIADFGMSRELKYEEDYYRSKGGQIPLRWTAPEALYYKKFSEKSDVWSFGMTMYEIWSLGYKPWFTMENEEIIQQIDAMITHPPPTGCPLDIYKIMVSTWSYQVDARPSFTEVRNMLECPISLSRPNTGTDADIMGNDPILAIDLYKDELNVYLDELNVLCN